MVRTIKSERSSQGDADQGWCLDGAHHGGRWTGYAGVRASRLAVGRFRDSQTGSALGDSGPTLYLGYVIGSDGICGWSTSMDVRGATIAGSAFRTVNYDGNLIRDDVRTTGPTSVANPCRGRWHDTVAVRRFGCSSHCL